MRVIVISENQTGCTVNQKKKINTSYAELAKVTWQEGFFCFVICFMAQSVAH